MGPISEARPSARGQRSGFSVRALPAEVRLTLLLLALSFFISGVPRVYTQTAAHALFIQAYGAEAMPWAYLAEALCVPLAGWLYIRAERVLDLRALLVGTLVTQIVALVLFRLGIGAGVPLVAGASIVYFEIEFVLSSLLLWGLANQLMTLRQGKRLFGFVSAGEPVAIIVCGLSTPLLLRWLSAADLFLLSALGAAVGIALVLHILRHHQPLADAAPAESGKGATAAAAQAWWRQRYVLTMVLLVAVGQMAYFFVDSAFYIEAGQRYPGEQEMAAFLGVYSAAMGAVSLVCSVLLAPWLLRRFGVRAGLLVLPVLLLAGSLGTLVAYGLGGPADLLFLLVVGNKVIDQSFRYTLDKTTFVTLFQPLPSGLRMRVQAGLESIVEPLAGGVAGLALFALIHAAGFGAVGITGVILAVACLWTGLVAAQYRGYLGALRAALAGRRLGTQRLSRHDRGSGALLRQGLASPRAGEVLYCLSLMDEMELSPTPAEAEALVRHAAREVRLDVARRAERGALRLGPVTLAEVAAGEADPQVQGAWLEALAAADDDPVPRLSAYLAADDEHVRLGAHGGLLRHGGIEGVLAVGPHLLDSLQATDPARRRFAARVMGRAASESFYRPLLLLLADADTGVARAALRAAGELQVAALWPAVLQALARPALEAAAVAALVRIGEPVLPLLDAHHARADLQPAQHAALVQAWERMASPAADERLAALLLTPGLPPPPALHDRVLRALWRRRYRSPPGHLARHLAVLDERLHHQADAADRALAAWAGVEGGSGPALELLRRVAADGMATAIDNLFALLALQHPDADLHGAHARYRRGGATQRSYVVEMLDNLLGRDLKRRLLPVIEADGMAQGAALWAAAHPGRADAGIDAVLRDLTVDTHATGLMQACAVYAAAGRGLAPPEPPGAGAGPLLRQTCAWARDGAPGLEKRKTMLMIERMLVLRSVALFGAVREEHLVSAAASAAEVHVVAGERLFAEGDIGNSLFVIASGRLEVLVRGQRVNMIGAREVVGEMAVLDAEPRSATVVALEDSLLLRLTSEDLDLLMGEDVEIARGIIQTLCRRLRQRDTPAP